jgi:hypothetical protein
MTWASCPSTLSPSLPDSGQQYIHPVSVLSRTTKGEFCMFIHSISASFTPFLIRSVNSWNCAFIVCPWLKNGSYGLRTIWLFLAISWENTVCQICCTINQFPQVSSKWSIKLEGFCSRLGSLQENVLLESQPALPQSQGFVRSMFSFNL